jgi:glycerate 2-kinase
VAAGLRAAVPGLDIAALPVADGGDGTVDAAVAAGFTRHTVRVTGPLGESVQAAYALRDGTAVVEMAEASGLRHLPPGVFAPRTATTYGTGELLLAALDAGARTIVLGVGGSATTDGGAGMLAALGARLLDAHGAPVAPGGAALASLATADLGGLDPRLAATEVVLASDVDNPLLGPTGAAAVYGPQKGADADDVRALDAALAHYAEVLGAADLAAAPGAGAAGGIGFGALVALRAAFRPGIDVLLDVLGFADAVEGATLVITGEGSLDEQTLHGKAPVGVARAAAARGVRVAAVCGRLAVPPTALAAAGISAAYPLSALEPDPARSIAAAGPLLERVATTLAQELLL